MTQGYPIPRRAQLLLNLSHPEAQARERGVDKGGEGGYMTVIIVIVIIAVILFVLMGGFNPVMLTTDLSNMTPLAANQWQCEETIWTDAPKIEHGLFKGTLRIDCRFEAINGGGMIELRRYLVDRIPTLAETVHGETVQNFDGLPSTVYDVSMKVNEKDEEARVRGKTYVATDGFTRLRHVFIADNIASRGAAKYLKGMRSELNITQRAQPHWYDVQIVNSSTVEKPWGIPGKVFKRELVKKIETDIREKAEAVLTSVSNHL